MRGVENPEQIGAMFHHYAEANKHNTRALEAASKGEYHIAELCRLAAIAEAVSGILAAQFPKAVTVRPAPQNHPLKNGG